MSLTIRQLVDRQEADSGDLSLIQDLLSLHESDPDAPKRLDLLLQRHTTYLDLRLENLRRVRGDDGFASTGEAISGAGYRAAHSAALVVAVMEWLNTGCQVLDYLAYWRHAVAAGVLAAVAGVLRYPDEAFAVGLLHDLGRFTLDHHDPEALLETIALANASGSSLSDAERAVLGFTEADIAEALTARLGFPAWISPTVVLGDDGHIARDSLAGLSRVACLTATMLEYPDGTGIHEPIPPALAPMAEQLMTALTALGGLDWLAQRVDRALAVALFDAV